MCKSANAFHSTRGDPQQLANGNVALPLDAARRRSDHFRDSLPASRRSTSPDFRAGDLVLFLDFNASTGPARARAGLDTRLVPGLPAGSAPVQILER